MNFTRRLVFAPALLLVSLALAATAQGQEIVYSTDGSGFAGWYDTGSVTALTDSSNEHPYLHIAGSTGSAVLNLDTTLLTGGGYALQFLARNASTSDRASAVIKFSNSSWQSLGSASVTVSDVGATMSSFTSQFTVPTGTAHSRLYLQKTAGTGSTDFESVKVSSVSATTLKYAPPVLSNPITIQLGNGITVTKLDVTKDYIIEMPAAKKTGSTIIMGGHNVVIKGGYLTIPTGYVTPPQVLDSSSSPNNPQYGGLYVGAALYIKDNEGTVHIEGLLIDGSGGAESDAIDISSPLSTVQIENVRVEGIYGFHDQLHSDIIQPFGGVHTLLVDKLTGLAGYQGLSIWPVTGTPSGATAAFSRVNLSSTGTPIYGNHNNGGYLIWLTDVGECNGAYPVSFTDVYVTPRSPNTLGNAVWPPVGSSTTCASAVSADGQSVSFPLLPVTGSVLLGAPALGDYVPASSVGLKYSSPGYQ